MSTLAFQRPENLDAVRVADGRPVYLKRINKSSKELEITQLLSSEELRTDPRNNCIPFIDWVDDPLDSDMVILVLPLLHPIVIPYTFSVREAVDFISQTLNVSTWKEDDDAFANGTLPQGLAFMHEHEIAHRFGASCKEHEFVLKRSLP